MLKARMHLIVILTLAMLVISACAGAGPGNTTGDTNGAGANTVNTPAVVDTPADGGTTTDGTGDAVACANAVATDLVSAGQGLFADRCAACHGQQGEGVGDFPALANNQVVTGDDLAALVTGYFAVEAHPKDVTPDQLASLLSYVRGSFGNTAAAVCPEQITIPAQ